MNTKEKLELRILINDFIASRQKISPSISAICTELTASAALLGKAWSTMAQRNIVADMVRLLTKMQADKTLPGPDKLRCIDVRKSVSKYLGQHSPGVGRYDAVVCVGYKIRCAGAKYSGKPDDYDDMVKRCKAMAYAIRSAYSLVDTMGGYNASSNILKIFMAPEFYFRGRNGAYTHEVVHGREAQPDAKPPLPKLKGIMEIMQEEINDPAYKDWLFVLGTAIAATELTEHVCKDCTAKVTFVPDKANPGKTKAVCSANSAHATREKSRGAIVENVALVKKENDTHTVTKETVSHVDYVEDKAAGLRDKVTVMGKRLDVHRTMQPSGYNSATNVPTKFQDERMGGSIFTIDGVTIGLEVCLDHAAKSSATTGRLEHAANIQIQLIPSAGMSIGTLRTVPGGVVFNVDGLTPHVEVISGVNPTVELSYPKKSFADVGIPRVGDIALTGATRQQLITTGTNMDSRYGPALADVVTGVSAPRPNIGHAGSGCVIAYGPFDIPRI